MFQLRSSESDQMPESKTSERRLSAAEKRVKALELRREGKTFQQIADALGYRSKTSAYDQVMKGLNDTMQEPADALRRLESERLDWLWREVENRMDIDHLWAVDRALKIMERRASLFGLDKQATQDLAEEAQRYLDLYEQAAKDAQDRSEA